MKEIKTGKYFWTTAKLVVTIVPVVIVMILIFIALTRNKILNLSRDKLILESSNCADDINTWTEQTINELNVYKNVIEKTCKDDREALDVMQTSCDISDVYPYGLYLGDENGTYLDGSGWVPGDDFVVTERNWYIEGLEHDELTFGEPYVDAMTGDVCVSATSRVHYKPAVCVLSSDIYLKYAGKIVENAAAGSIESAFCITEGSRIIITSSDEDMTGVSLNDYTDSKLYNNINILLDQGAEGQAKVNGDNGKYIVNIKKLDTNDWCLVTYVKWSSILGEMRYIVGIMVFVGCICSLILIFMTSSISKEMSYIRKKAQTDSLTRLLNRNGFREQVMHSLEENPEQGILIIIDMDNFKLVNDQLGHPEGDEVLKRFALILESYFNRNKDVTARIGGDEFAVYVGRKIEGSETEAMLRKFIRVFHENFDESYPKQKLSVSIGGAYSKDCGGVYEQLYHKSDSAMYEVKRNGKDNFIIL